MTNIRFQNRLPDIPFPPKFLPYSFDSQRFIQYKHTSLETEYKYKILAPVDVGVPIELVDARKYEVQPGIKLLDKDLPLLHDTDKPANANAQTTSLHFLLKPDYLGAENRVYGRNGISMDHKLSALRKDGDFDLHDDYDSHSARRRDGGMDRDEMLAEIEAGFEACRNTPRHPTNPDLVPVEILPIYPDFEHFHIEFQQCEFDSNPAPNKNSLTAAEQVSQALLIGRSEQDEQTGKARVFAGYYLPTVDTARRITSLRKRAHGNAEEGIAPEILAEPDVGEEFRFEEIREYEWEIKQKQQNYKGTGQEDMYCLSVRDGEVFYMPLHKKMKLKKKKAGEQRVEHNVLVVTHRELNEKDIKMRRVKERGYLSEAEQRRLADDEEFAEGATNGDE